MTCAIHFWFCYICPTVFFARADRIDLRLLYYLRLDRSSVLDWQFRNQ